MVWYIGSVSMRILKWTAEFNVEKESSLVPIWVTFPRLPIHFFAQPALFKIASLLGTPLRLDSATTLLKRPGVARLQVEINILKERPTQIWIGVGTSDGFWQRVEYENVPYYCTHCWHVGHAETHCHVRNPSLKPPPKGKLVYVPKVLNDQNPTSGPKPPVTTSPPIPPPITPVLEIPVPNPSVDVPTSEPPASQILQANSSPLNTSCEVPLLPRAPTDVMDGTSSPSLDHLPLFPTVHDDQYCVPSTATPFRVHQKSQHTDHDDMQLLQLDKHAPPLLSRDAIFQGLRDFSASLSALLEKHRQPDLSDEAPSQEQNALAIIPVPDAEEHWTQPKRRGRPRKVQFEVSSKPTPPVGTVRMLTRSVTPQSFQ